MQAGLEQEHCRQWLRGECFYGAKCKFRHEPSLKGRYEDVLASKRGSKQSKGRRGAKQRKSRRQTIFRHWLVEHCGLLDLRHVLDVCGGDGVLSLELLNLNACKVHSATVVDCRLPISRPLAKRLDAMHKGFYHMNPVTASKFTDISADVMANALPPTDLNFSSYEKCANANCTKKSAKVEIQSSEVLFTGMRATGMCEIGMRATGIQVPALNGGDSAQFEFRMPQYLRLYFDDSLFCSLQKSADGSSDHLLTDSSPLTRMVELQTKKLSGFFESPKSKRKRERKKLKQTDAKEVIKSDRSRDDAKSESLESADSMERIKGDCFDAMRALAECSCVVGLHCDNAAEYIVDFAFGSRKCFAIVPCCVFPNLHPKRRLRTSGVSVRSHPQFVEYLLDKYDAEKCTQNDYCIRKGVLERLGGRNVVIFGYPIPK